MISHHSVRGETYFSAYPESDFVGSLIHLARHCGKPLPGQWVLRHAASRNGSVAESVFWHFRRSDSTHRNALETPGDVAQTASGPRHGLGFTAQGVGATFRKATFF